MKWRIIIPRGTDFDETILHSPPPPTKHKGRIEYALIADSKDIKAGIVLNEKRAGVTFPDMAGNWTLIVVLEVMIRHFINGVMIFSILTGTRQQEKWYIIKIGQSHFRSIANKLPDLGCCRQGLKKILTSMDYRDTFFNKNPN